MKNYKLHLSNELSIYMLFWIKNLRKNRVHYQGIDNVELCRTI